MWQRIKSLPDWRYVAIIIPITALLQAIGPEHLRYERDWVQTGQIWRIVTGHWVHVGWVHWFLNSFSLVVMVILTTPAWSVPRWIINTVGLAIGISILMTLFNPEVKDMAGHSGVLYGLFILGALSLYAEDRLIAILVIFAILLKVCMEQFDFYDFNTSAFIGARVIVDSHMYGVFSAIAIALGWSTYTMNHGTTEQSN